MDNVENSAHQGQLLKQAVKRKRMGIEELMTRMHYQSRSTYYNHVKQPELDPDILLQYSKVLGIDLAAALGIGEDLVHESVPVYFAIPNTLEQALIELKYWRESFLQKEKEFEELKAAYDAVVKK